jgi:hypothetical protein
VIKGAAACHLRLQCDLKGWDKGLHLVHGHMSDLQERERDCRPVHCLQCPQTFYTDLDTLICKSLDTDFVLPLVGAVYFA